MTCLLGLHTEAGVGMIAVDGCVSWPGGNIQDHALQKVYALSPSIGVGVCGDIECARAVLQEVRGYFSDREMPSSSREVEAMRRRLPRAFTRALAHVAKPAIVQLVLLLTSSVQDSRVLTWSSERPSECQELARGGHVLLGSARNDDHIRRAYEEAAALVCRQHCLPGMDEELAIQWSSAEFNRITAKYDTASVGVGGLFQLATGFEGAVVLHGYDAATVRRGIGGFAATVSYDESTQRWWQQTNGGSLVYLLTLDEYDGRKRYFTSQEIAY